MFSDATMHAIAAAAAQCFELAGIVAILLGSFYALVCWIRAGFREVAKAEETASPFKVFRRQLGRSILLGLELLVAADIIRTVTVKPTLESVLVLGLIVIIRTFLSFSLEVEIDGKWPWQKSTRADPS